MLSFIAQAQAMKHQKVLVFNEEGSFMHCTSFGQKTFCLKTIKAFDSRDTWYEVLVTDDEI